MKEYVNDEMSLRQSLVFFEEAAGDLPAPAKGAQRAGRGNLYRLCTPSSVFSWVSDCFH